MSFFPYTWPFSAIPGRSSMYDNNESYERNLLQKSNYMYIKPFEKPRSVPQSTKDKTVNLLGREGFQVSLNVQNFAPNEITVKAVDNCVVVEGKHEEREDEHGYIYRHFVRRYELPTECNANQVSSSLSSDGILTVKSPRVTQSNERIIDIIQTGPAHLTIKDNPKEKTKDIPIHSDGKNEKKNKV